MQLTTQESRPMQLLYVADPMCSWCYGFGQELAAVLADDPALSLRIVVGGVRAGSTEVLDDAGKRFRLGHWERVEALTGLPFNRDALLARRGFVYDTEPVCRAVVVARRHVADRALLRAFRALQHGFYVEGRDTTDPRALAQLLEAALAAEGVELDATTLLAQWQDAAVIRETLADFTLSRRMGVHSFPALLAAAPVNAVVAPGFLPAAQLAQAIAQARQRRAAVAATTAPDW